MDFNVSLVFDIALIVLCVFYILRYAIRGFVRSLMALVKTLLAPLVSIIFCTPLAKVISNALFIDWSTNTVNNLLTSTQAPDGTYELYTLLEGIPNWFVNLLISGLDKETTDDLWRYFVGDTATGEYFSADIAKVDEFTAILGGQLSLLISIIISFIAIFVVAEILFVIIGALLNKLTQKSMVKVLNILLGAIIGAIIAAFIAMAICLGVDKVFEFGASYYPEVFKESILDGTILFKFFRDDFWAWIKSFAIS